MKKIASLIIAGTFVLSGAMAQNDESADQQNDVQLKSKKGVPILPEQGDWALGVNAVPFLNFLGNTMNGTSGNTTAFGFLNNNQTIFGKYFMEEDFVIRGALRVGVNSTKTDNFVQDMGAVSPQDMVKDTRSQNTGIYLLSGGIEKRKGNSRIQGYYGAELQLGLSTQSTEYEYGNALTESNPSVFYTDDFDAGTSTQGSQRPILSEAGTTWMVGARAFVGVEYFVAPKLSIGGEFGWGPMYRSQADGVSRIERANFNGVEEIETELGGEREFDMDTDNMQGALKVMFHF
jgi:hypothetical protein